MNIPRIFIECRANELGYLPLSYCCLRRSQANHNKLPSRESRLAVFVELTVISFKVRLSEMSQVALDGLTSNTMLDESSLCGHSQHVIWTRAMR